ncbi:DUF2971 domain-containing protein [Enterobacter ludwigii]|uniref:DUF2971 domain-containing protein n=1 Tax=Enterobacter ludwigii TaxID=299767 RepID=UPI003976D4AD
MKIYHYTDLNGLKGILENNSLWATNYAFLNDSQEIKHGINCIINALDNIHGKIKNEHIELVKNTVQFFKEVTSKHAYNISFCLKPDLLSMWRGYGQAQKVCLEFDSNELFEAIDTSDKVIYDRNVIYTEENSTIEAIDGIVEFFNNEKVIEDITKSDLDELYHAITLAQLLPPFFKVKHFEEELEYRFVIYTQNKNQDVKIRVGNKGIIPYIELKMNKHGPHGGKLPLKKIMIGPGQNIEELINGIEIMLDVYKYNKVDITTSKVPFKG